MKHDRVSDGARRETLGQRDRVCGKAGMHFAIRVSSDIAEVSGVMRYRVGRAVHHSSRIEVCAGVLRVVPTVALLMDVESVDAGWNSGQVHDNFDVAVAD